MLCISTRLLVFADADVLMCSGHIQDRFPSYVEASLAHLHLRMFSFTPGGLQLYLALFSAWE